jgi:hypothetical protein
MLNDEINKKKSIKRKKIKDEFFLKKKKNTNWHYYEA